MNKLISKKIITICCIICIALSLSNTTTMAATSDFDNYTNDDEVYYEDTTITYNEIPSIKDISGAYSVSATSTTKQVTATKKTSYKNSNGTVLWYVSITATFKYTGKISWCSSCTPSAGAVHSSWKIKSYTSSKSGSKATATATATRSSTNTTYTKSVTIQCSDTGEIS